MINIWTLIESGIPITWTMILLGRNGFLGYPPLLTSADVIEYATRLVSSSDGGINDNILQIASSHPGDVSLDRLISELAEPERTSSEDEMRKWRVLLLKDLLDKVPKEAFYGHLTLEEFWSRFGGIPEALRDSFSSMSEYYLPAHLDEIIREHHEWAIDEIERMKMSD